MLIVGEVELNPGPQMEEKLMDFLTEQREEMRGTCEWLENNKSSLDMMSVKTDLMNERIKILMKEQEMTKQLVNLWKAKLRETITTGLQNMKHWKCVY
jgi:hypothetical protein